MNGSNAMEPDDLEIQIREDELRQQIYEMEDLPTLPVIAQQIMVAVDREDGSVRSLTRIVEQDPSLTVKLLGLANAAYYGQQSKVGTVNRAITVIGTAALKQLALCAFVNASWGRDAEREHFWKHSIAVAFGAEYLARQTDAGVSPDDAFCAGLLHDVGILVLGLVLPEEYQEVERSLQKMGSGSRQAEERKLLGVDHALAGGWLADRWKLPPLLVEAIAGHHANPGDAMARMIQIAEGAAMTSELGLSGESTTRAHEQESVETYLRTKGKDIDAFFRIATAKEKAA